MYFFYMFTLILHVHTYLHVHTHFYMFTPDYGYI